MIYAIYIHHGDHVEINERKFRRKAGEQAVILYSA